MQETKVEARRVIQVLVHEGKVCVKVLMVKKGPRHRQTVRALHWLL